MLRALIALAACLSPALCSSPARGDALDQIQKRGTLIWGADKEGGGPYVFPDDNDPDLLRGFEVELAEMLAEELGSRLGTEIRAQFKQGQWDSLPQMLGGEIDVALNGFELTPERQRDYLCTRPYYVYGLQLLVPRDSSIANWNDVKAERAGEHWRGGTLGGSSASRYLRENYGETVVTIDYNGNTDAMDDVANGRLDLTLQDDCIALFYADRFPQLRFVGRPVGEGYYVALVDKGEPRLQEALNKAIGNIIADGRLEQLYDRWDMSGRAQALALRTTTEVVAAPRRSFAEIVATSLPTLLSAAAMTVFLAIASMPIAILLGIGVALGRLYGPRWLAALLTGYVEILRGTPLLLQLWALYFLLPRLVPGLALNAVVAAIAGLAINYSAYEAEIYRAGLQAIPRGQMEAALALGMTRRQSIRRIVLPQAVRIVIPPVTNDFIALFKDTSVCSVITVVELTKQYSILAQSTGAIIELAIITAVLYLLMSYPLSLVARWSERRLGGKHA